VETNQHVTECHGKLGTLITSVVLNLFAEGSHKQTCGFVGQAY